MIYRAAVMTTTILIAGLMSAAFPAAATPDSQPPPSGDDRATSHAGNASTCADAGLAGQIVLRDDNPGTQYLTIDPADIPAGQELTGIVVKGGNGYNVYPPQHRTDLHAPLVGKGKNIPTISHWFACAQSTTTQPSTPPQQSSSATPPPTSERSVPSSDAAAPTTTTTPAAQGAVAGEVELAATGFSPLVPVSVSVVLLLAGTGLLLLLRRIGHRHD